METIIGDNQPNDLVGIPEQDNISRLEENDNFYSAGGYDSLLGGGGNDFLEGGPGSDVINGGDDAVYLGRGNDTYLSFNGDGVDTLPDFVAGGTEDAISLLFYAVLEDFANFDEFLASGRLQNIDGHTQLVLNVGDVLRFTNVADVSQFAADDFIFIGLA
jgi:Ca2+-binding RTX toxin-like protein